MTRKLPITTLEKSASTNAEMTNILSVMEKLLHWAAIIESSDDAIISKSIDGYITSWNPGAQRLYGYTAEEIIGKPVSLLMPSEKKDDFPFIMKQLHEGKRVEHYQTERMTKDGQIRHVSITVSPIRDMNGNIIGASKIARDITDKVELEHRRNEFVSVASHELKTPITSQKAFGELLERLIDKKDYAELKPFIQKINAQTVKLTTLVEDLLELSRVETGMLRIEKQPFKIDKLVAEICDDMQTTSGRTIVKDTQSNATIYGDSERIGQVLVNLLSNAIKYSDSTSTVTVTSTLDDGMVTLAVQDQGIGIEKKYYEKIFERFFRATDEDEKTYPGMGIGLHLSHQIILYHDGKIWVESKKDEGSTFYVTLPATEAVT